MYSPAIYLRVTSMPKLFLSPHISPFLAGVRSEMDSRRKSFVLSSPILRAILTFLFENGKAYPNVITQDKFLISHFLFRDHYFTGVSWSPKSDRVAVNWMNRGQNVSIVSECKDPIWICTEVRNPRRAYFPDLPEQNKSDFRNSARTSPKMVGPRSPSPRSTR